MIKFMEKGLQGLQNDKIKYESFCVFFNRYVDETKNEPFN